MSYSSPHARRLLTRICNLILFGAICALAFLPLPLVKASVSNGPAVAAASAFVLAEDGGLINWDPDVFPARYQVNEATGSVTLTLHRTRSTTGRVTVDYTTYSLSATADKDFVQTQGTVVFENGESLKTVTITILDDALIEPDELFTVRLSNPTGGAQIGHQLGDRGVSDIEAEVTIKDNDAPARLIYGVTRNNELVSFWNYAPGTFVQFKPINGEKLLGIDFRPATGELYGLGLSGQLYIINRSTAELTAVGSPSITGLTELRDIGFDFNPVTDRIRVTIARDYRNLQLNPDTGAIASVDSPLTPIFAESPVPFEPEIIGLAHSNNFPGATSTTTYGIRFVTGFSSFSLVTLGSPGGSPISPNSGKWFHVGGASGDTDDIGGFDIADMGAAYATITHVFNGHDTFLALVDLERGSANELSHIGDGSHPMRDISVEPLPIVQFKASLFSVNEDAGSASITVRRIGGTGETSRVNYATSNGTAQAGADYQPASGTLEFLPGETSKTFSIPLINDSTVEGIESVNLTLTPYNGSGAIALGALSTARLAIMDEPTEPGTNPIDNPQFFVRQHYLDFLSREPEQGGLDFWTNNITRCSMDGDPLCVHQRRIGTSAAFFIANEFQETGSFVYRLYRGGLGRQPNFAEFSADRPQVVGGAGLEANKVAFADRFVQRPEFVQKYQGLDTAESFVDALIATINATSHVDITDQRNWLISNYNNGKNVTESRSRALRAAIEDSYFTAAEYNPSFVLMQYFGYLKRDPEIGGYQFWLNVLNNKDPNNYRGMVCAFITSAEYQHRFGTLVTHNNSECR